MSQCDRGLLTSSLVGMPSLSCTVIQRTVTVKVNWTQQASTQWRSVISSTENTTILTDWLNLLRTGRPSLICSNHRKQSMEKTSESVSSTTTLLLLSEWVHSQWHSTTTLLLLSEWVHYQWHSTTTLLLLSEWVHSQWHISTVRLHSTIYIGSCWTIQIRRQITNTDNTELTTTKTSKQKLLQLPILLLAVAVAASEDFKSCVFETT